MIVFVDLFFAYFAASIFALSLHLIFHYNQYFFPFHSSSSRLICHGDEHSMPFSRQRSVLVRSKEKKIRSTTMTFYSHEEKDTHAEVLYMPDQTKAKYTLRRGFAFFR